MTLLPEPSPAPLLSDDALRELFERDPLQLTRADFTVMVDWARAQRQRWQSEEKEARSAGRKARSKVAALPSPALDPETASL